MSASGTAELGSAVRVVVTPSQSSYFAGEPFSVTITFTNTRTPDSGPSRPFSHTRGAHSVSSAPLARPPTSPGTPRTSVLATPTRARKAGSQPVRKGLIGRGYQLNVLADLPQLIEQRRKKLLAKSLSVSIAPGDLEDRLRDECMPTSAPAQHASYSTLNYSPRSPLARSPSFPIPSNHPHARKHSVFDGQLQLHEMSHSIPPSPLLTSFTPSASNSSFSLVLDPIAENMPLPYPSMPDSPNVETHAVPPTYPSRLSKHARRPNQVGLGQPPGISKSHPDPRTAFSSGFPQSNVELILYSYVQLTGTVNILPPNGTVPTQDQINTLNALRSTLAKRPAVGGGSMDITPSLRQQQSPNPQARRPAHRRSVSFSSGLLSLLSPSSLATSTSTPLTSPPLRSSSSSVFPGLLSPSPSGGTVGKSGVAQQEVDPEMPLPTFEVQPAMIAVDLSIRPGESRSYTYTIPLPENLPPTFRGRTMRFSYELVVGTCRASSSPTTNNAGSTGANSISRVMKVPIRVYNNVAVGKPPIPYDLLWPVAKRIQPASNIVIQVVDGVGPLLKSVAQELYSPGMHCGSFNELQDYAQRLLVSFPEEDANGTKLHFPPEAVRGEIEREEEGVLTGCREAVELLTRNPKKVSYDVTKGGVKVAVLTFTKSAYRLGETVLGVVELNERTSLARVLQLSAKLESQETLPSSISPPSNSRNMRRVHAEHHSSFVLSTLRTTFSLDIPSDSSPAFQVNVGGETASGGLEWKVRLCLLVAVASESSLAGTEGVRFKSMVRDGPRGRWGSAWKAPPKIPPMECADARTGKEEAPFQNRSWVSFFAASFLGLDEGDGQDPENEGEDEEYDGVRGSREGGVGVGVNFGGGEDGWREVQVETVECEVPIKVWAGNTVFKAVEVEFHV